MAEQELTKPGDRGRKLEEHLRTGVKLVASTVIAFGLGIIADRVAPQTTFYLPDKIEIIYPAPKPKIPILRTEEICRREAEEVAKKSYRETGHYDLEALKKIESGYLEYLINLQIPAEQKVPSSFAKLMPVIKDVANTLKLDPNLLASIELNECFSYQYCVGPKDELGYMQINLKEHKLTEEEYANIFDAKTNIMEGALIFKGYLNRCNGDVKKAVESYNAGPNNIKGNKVAEEYFQRENGRLAVIKKRFNQN